MPNIWTHILFIDELCKRTDKEELMETSSIGLHIGAQGPDPFFYHQFWPFLPKGDGEDIGMQLHTENCGPFLVDMVKKGVDQKHEMQAFILGFISHHYLDRITHPYVHYHSGYEANKHQLLEVAIDTFMLEKKLGLKTWKTPAYKEIRPKQLIEPITNLLTELIDKHLAHRERSSIQPIVRQSYKHMYQAQVVLYDPRGWKNRWFSSLVSAFSHKPLDDKDYVNDSHNIWYHSATNQPYQESFIDLYERALEEGSELFSIIFEYWSSPSHDLLEEIKIKISNISYDTGRPLYENQTNRFSSPIV
ncbi:zinc dependent phospholipase C family protein [Halobacillus locisalis]|uniref:Zinc dependent phospholipase C family protein n=1 Tax=Halobacillus locisalis TaxID=220753 RepID=A0A838CRF3_9BACI|nr:zinc dependent phospholipase C family protein [Halobacillus locisalis]